MPGWQQFAENHKSENVQVVAVAMDVQGPDKARPWVEKAGATFPVLVDRRDELGGRFRFNFIPLTILFDEEGRVVRGPRYTDIREAAHRGVMEAWLLGGADALSKEKVAQVEHSGFANGRARLWFQFGAYELSEGLRDRALAAFENALEDDPNNWIIHKQIWALEHPHRFYEGNVDFEWQKEQLRREREAGSSVP